jgi:hypothetical protein
MTVQIGARVIMPCQEHAERLIDGPLGPTNDRGTYRHKVFWLRTLWAAYVVWTDCPPVSTEEPR